MPAPIAASIPASAGNGASATNASQRPGSASRASRAAAGSAARSASVASRTGIAAEPALSLTRARTAAGSIRWSNAANRTASRRTGPPCGWRATRRGAGVENDQATSAASAPPFAARVPAGTTTR